MARYGAEIINKHLELKRLSEAAIDIYAMTACIGEYLNLLKYIYYTYITSFLLGRASRSYCIGLQNADTELLLTNAFCMKAKARVQARINEICQGPHITSDSLYSKISNKMSHFGKYYPSHPLSRNF